MRPCILFALIEKTNSGTQPNWIIFFLGGGHLYCMFCWLWDDCFPFSLSFTLIISDLWILIRFCRFCQALEDGLLALKSEFGDSIEPIADITKDGKGEDNKRSFQDSSEESPSIQTKKLKPSWRNIVGWMNVVTFCILVGRRKKAIPNPEWVLCKIKRNGDGSWPIISVSMSVRSQTIKIELTLGFVTKWIWNKPLFVEIS